MLEQINSLLWGKLMIALLSLLGIKLLILTRFYPIRKAKFILSCLFSQDRKDSSAPSPFQTMCTALGGTIGVGNTVGVAAAIAVGGAGAVLWMIVSAFFAMIIKFCETWLSARYRDNSLGFGGPMHYIRTLLHSPLLAALFSLSVLPASLFVGNLAQSDLVCSSLESIFRLPPLLTGVLLALLVGWVIFGGAKRITDCASVLVPLMSVFYVILCAVMLLGQIHRLPWALMRMVTEAFSFDALAGGAGGFALSKAISCGFSKGMFSNEAGMGSAPMAHTQSGEGDPEKQGAWGIVEVFIDTVVICLLTALVILTCSDGSQDVLSAVLSCFTGRFGTLGAVFFALSMTLFAFASMCAWSMYADCALKTLTSKKLPRLLFRAVFTACIPLSVFLSTEHILSLSDLFNAVMALPNVLSLLVITSLKPTKQALREL